MTERILIIDDDPGFSESNKDLLEAYGYEVMCAPDGRRGLDCARSFKPALIILDVMMTTNTEGFEVARELKKNEELKNIHVLMVTGIVREMGLPACPRPDTEWLPVDRVLEKPIDPARLLREVERMLAHKEREA